MNSGKSIAVRRALISVSDKSGIATFAQALHGLGIEILSTGGTCKLLAGEGIPVTEISDYTGFPEMMDGRVKTLHPRIHGGILARRDQDQAVMETHDIPPIDLVVVNLYPFAATVAKPDCDLATAIENIDIGGPTMLRAAAKNHQFVAVVVNPSDYAVVLEQLQQNDCCLDQQTRFRLAVRCFEHTAAYEDDIANYLGGRPEINALDKAATDSHKEQEPRGKDKGQSLGHGQNSGETDDTEPFPNTFNTQFHKRENLRYGENSHQGAAFYVENSPAEACIATATQHQGKALSYNNIADADAALECVKCFGEAACVIVKHANPCGVALADTPLGAYELAFQTDPTSAFGGIIAFNRELDAETARRIVEQQFSELIIAPAVSGEALAVTAEKKNVRVLSCGYWEQPAVGQREQTGGGNLEQQRRPALDYKRVNGGLLVQDRDIHQLSADALEVVGGREPTGDEIRDLLFAWHVCQYVKSNAIVYAKNTQTIGIGAGQMSRVYSARIAGIKAADENLEVKGSVMASDAFFPFRDGIDAAAKAGITAVIQPGGSLRDAEVIAAADEAGMAMVFTGVRHFRH